MKKGYKFNVIDAVVIVAIIGVLAFAGIKLAGGGEEEIVEMHRYEFSFRCDDVPDFVLEYLKEGEAVDCVDNNDCFGKVVSVEIGDSAAYSVSAEGKVVKSVKPDHSGVELVVEGEGEQTDTGVKLTKGVYGVGHSIVLRTGNAKVAGKISGIKQLD